MAAAMGSVVLAAMLSGCLLSQPPTGSPTTRAPTYYPTQTATIEHITVYRATSRPSATTELGNANAADVIGEMAFLDGDCLRRNRRDTDTLVRRDDDTAVVRSQCDDSDVIMRFEVSAFILEGCYISMTEGDCGFPLGDRCNGEWSNCTEAGEVTDGLVGRINALHLGGGTPGGYWYSFQRDFECSDGQSIGDNGCTWKSEPNPKAVPVCCVNIATNETFYDSFESCPNVSDASTSHYVCPSGQPSTSPTHHPTQGVPTSYPTVTATIEHFTVYRSVSEQYDSGLGNDNAADIIGEIAFLDGGCVRRHRHRRYNEERRDDNPDIVRAPCDNNDVIVQFEVTALTPIECYIQMGGGICFGTIGPRCDGTITNCAEAAEYTDGRVGRVDALHIGGGPSGGHWYSFQREFECIDGQSIGDNNCTWKTAPYPKRVPVCCVNLATNDTFLDSFQTCQNVSNILPPFACPTDAPAVKSSTQASRTPSLSSATTTGGTMSTSAAQRTINSLPSTLTDKHQQKLSADDDVGIGVGIAAFLAMVVLIATFVCGASRQRIEYSDLLIDPKQIISSNNPAFDYSEP